MSFLLEALKFTGILICVLLIFNFIILIHEWGHFLAARWRGLKIEKFQIWMGKPIWKRTWNGVQYGLGTIPLGGFVQLPQMAPMGGIEGKEGAHAAPLPAITPLDKIIVAFAGPLFSFLLAVAFACAVSVAGKPVKTIETNCRIGYLEPGEAAERSGALQPGDTILEIDGKPVKGFFRLADSVVWSIASGSSDDVTFKIRREGEAEPRTVTVHAPLKASEEYRKWDQETGWFQKLWKRPPLRRVGIGPAEEMKVYEVEKDSPGADAGLQKGDVILTINGVKTLNATYINALARRKPDQPIELTLQHGGSGKVEKATIVPRVKVNGKEAKTGVLFESADDTSTTYEYIPPFRLVGDCFRNTASTLRALFSPGSSIGVGHVSGPVGILNLYYNIFQNPDWWRLILWFSVVLNIGLAVFNMLPLPVLDGGHITMAILEKLRGRALGTKLLEYVQVVCVLALLTMVLFVTFKDVGGIFGGGEPKESWPERSAPATP